MEFKTRKNIILFISYIALIIFALVNFKSILGAIGYIINLFWPFIIGALLAFGLNVLVNFIERKVFGKIKSKIWKKMSRAVSITISVVLVILIIVFVMKLLIPQLRNSVVLFTDSLPEYKEDIIEIMNKFDVENGTIVKVSEYLDNFSKVITDFIKVNSKDVISITTEVATSILGIVSKTVISIVFAIYILAQKETLHRQVNKVMSAYLKPKTIDKINKIGSMANKTFSSFVTGQCLEAIILGSLCFIGMLIFRFPYASTISVLIGFTALVPIFGSFIGTSLGFFLIFMVNPAEAVLFVVFILILQQFDDNLIYPRVVGKSVGLPGMWVLLAVTIGGSVGGILGMLVATPLCSLIYSLFTELVNEKIRKNRIATKVNEKGLLRN